MQQVALATQRGDMLTQPATHSQVCSVEGEGVCGVGIVKVACQLCKWLHQAGRTAPLLRLLVLLLLQQHFLRTRKERVAGRCEQDRLSY